MDKKFPYYQLTFRWSRRGQELMFSWPLSIPFAILHVDLWMPNKYTDNRGSMALINAMRNMSQFVVVVSIPDETSTTLANDFFQHILIKFGMCHLAVLDVDNSFAGALVAVCKSLKLNYDIFTKRNRKESVIEHFHRFLNKATTIFMEDWQSNEIFVYVGTSTRYTWNITPINGTNIIHSTVAIGRELRFPIDIYLSALPKLTQNNT